MNINSCKIQFHGQAATPLKTLRHANVVLKNLGWATPLVATNTQGVEELFGCPEASAVACERTSEAIVSANKQLSENLPSQAATRTHTESLGWQQMIDGFLKIVHEIA